MENYIDLQDISFIIPIRIDTDERGQNLEILYNFYKKSCINVQFIFVENDKESKSIKWVCLDKNDKYYLIQNDKEFNKCLTYNIGAKLSDRKYFCFMDIDVIVRPIQIIKAQEKIEKYHMDLMIAYNGVALYLTEKIKQEFSLKMDYDLLQSLIPENPRVNYKNDFLLVGNIHAVGGCLLIERNIFFKFNGFNPLIWGWGFDDNEIISRTQRLGYQIGQINGKNDVLWHFPHENHTSLPKNHHSHYNINHQIVDMVEHLTKLQLQEYIKTWEIKIN